ncbi:hypothetical protein [Tsukamurella pseudospumae]|nr:hypothetical protein [Tsukamurella pseudospumae]
MGFLADAPRRASGVPRPQFGSHGLLSFLVDDEAEMLIIFSIVWIG